MNTKHLEHMFMALAAILATSCGLQVRQDPTISGGNPVVNPPVEKVYTVGGKATGIKYDPVSIPTGYAANMPNGIVLTINGEEFPITENGSFTFPDTFKNNEAYEVSIADNGIVIEHADGVTPPIYLNCDLTNTIGVIDHANVTNVRVDCFLGDTQYKDPWEL